MRRSSHWLAPLTVLAVLDAVATLALPAVLGHAVDSAVAAFRAADSDGAGWTGAQGALLATAGLVGLLMLVEAATSLLTGVGAARATGSLRRRMVRHVLAVGPRLTQSTAEGDLVTRLGAGAAMTGKAVTVVAGLTAAVIPPIGGVIALLIIDPWLALTFMVGMASISGALRAYLRESRAASAGYLEALGAIAARLVDALAGARTIAAAQTTPREVERALVPLPRLRQHGVALWENIARLAFKGEPVLLLTQLAVVAAAGFALSAGRLTAGELLAASRYALMAGGIGGVLDELAIWARARGSTQRVAEVWAEPAVRYGHQTLPPGPGRLELHRVTVRTGGTAVLDGLDLVVPGGAVVALVGRSGAGKSLVAALAGRLRDPDEGEVRLDGVALQHLDRCSLRRAVAYAFDRPSLMGRTLSEAIGLGLDEPSSEQVRTAARAAHADRFIARLPDGYEAVLAETPMSGGELQRLGLARAFAREARLLILDDAMSSLDTATEADIAAALTNSTARLTRVIVTHRAMTAASADFVAWLDEGRIRATGPHHELWMQPAYRAVFQFERDRHLMPSHEVGVKAGAAP